MYNHNFVKQWSAGGSHQENVLAEQMSFSCIVVPLTRGLRLLSVYTCMRENQVYILSFHL